MKSNLPNLSPPALKKGPATTAALAAWRRAGFRLSRWPSLTDFRSRAFHLRQHRKSTRTRFSLLRGVTLMSALAVQLTFQPACGGTITGTVHAEGRAGTENTGTPDAAYGSRKYKFVPLVDYAAMKDFVVFIDGLTVTNATASTNVVQVTTARVAQHSATFSPHILPILAGTTVEWPNNDDIFHNVFSMSDAKQFDLGLYKNNPPNKHVTFDKPDRKSVV